MVRYDRLLCWLAAVAAVTFAIAILLYAGAATAVADTPATVSFSMPDYEMNGATGAVLTIPLIRQGDLTGDAYVYVNVSGGTATYRQDYTLETGEQDSAPVHFKPGAAESVIRFTWTGSPVSAGDRIAIIRLTPAAGATLGPVNVTMITIRNYTTSGTVTPTPSGSQIPLPTATLTPSGSPSVIITPLPSSSPSSAPTAGTTTPTPTTGAKGTPSQVPLPSQSPFPGTLLTLLGVIGGCALLYGRKK
ncbi:MAG TPA: hypothetical protein VGJ92_07625 [Methanocella sp.]|jgi:hypothetical protein